MKCQSWRLLSLIGAAAKYGLGFLLRSVDSLRRRLVDGLVIFRCRFSYWVVNVGVDGEVKSVERRIQYEISGWIRLGWAIWGL